MKLFYAAASPYARKVRIVLAELAVPHEAIAVDLAKAPAEFTTANPNRRVPTLVDGSLQLYESNIILDYLLQNYGGQAGGSAGGDRPLARSIARPDHVWEDRLMLETVETLLDCARIPYHLKRNKIAAEGTDFLNRELRRIESELDWLEDRIGPQGYLPGVLSIQDLNLTVALLWMDYRKPVPWRGRPNLEALVARNEGRPSFQSTRPDA